MTQEEKSKKLIQISKVLADLTVRDGAEILALAFGAICLNTIGNKKLMILFTEDFKKKVEHACLTSVYLLKNKQDGTHEEE